MNLKELWPTVWQAVSDSVESGASGLGRTLPWLIVAAVVLAIAWWLGLVTLAATRRVLARTSTSGHVDLLVARFARACVVGIGVVAALAIVGVDLGALVASLGLVGLTIGLALKDVLSNYVAGVMLLLQGPFRVGDTIVVEGIEGTVVDVRARATSLRAADGRDIHIPNSTMFAATVTNVTTNPTRRFRVALALPGHEDPVLAREVVLAAIRSTPGVLKAPPADASIEKADASAVRIVGHGWVDTTNHAVDDVRSAALAGAAGRLRDRSSSMAGGDSG